MDEDFSDWKVTWLPLSSALRSKDKPKFEILSTFTEVSKADFRKAWPFRLPINSTERQNQIGGITVINSNDPADLLEAHRKNPFLPNPYAHVHFESLIEAEWILRFDRTDDIRWITAQPFSVSATDSDGKQRRHVPDLLTVDRNGVVEVVDVKPMDRLDSPRTVRSVAISNWLCGKVGWKYRTVSEPEHTERMTFRYLRRARHSRFEQDCLDTIVANAVDGTRSGSLTLLDLADSCSGWSDSIAPILHLIWTGELAIDETKQLTEFARVTVPGAVGS